MNVHTLQRFVDYVTNIDRSIKIDKIGVAACPPSAGYLADAIKPTPILLMNPEEFHIFSDRLHMSSVPNLTGGSTSGGEHNSSGRHDTPSSQNTKDIPVSALGKRSNHDEKPRSSNEFRSLKNDEDLELEKSPSRDPSSGSDTWTVDSKEPAACDSSKLGKSMDKRMARQGSHENFSAIESSHEGADGANQIQAGSKRGLSFVEIFKTTPLVVYVSPNSALKHESEQSTRCAIIENGNKNSSEQFLKEELSSLPVAFPVLLFAPCDAAGSSAQENSALVAPTTYSACKGQLVVPILEAKKGSPASNDEVKSMFCPPAMRDADNVAYLNDRGIRPGIGMESVQFNASLSGAGQSEKMPLILRGDSSRSTDAFEELHSSTQFPHISSQAAACDLGVSFRNVAESYGINRVASNISGDDTQETKLQHEEHTGTVKASCHVTSQCKTFSAHKSSPPQCQELATDSTMLQNFGSREKLIESYSPTAIQNFNCSSAVGEKGKDPLFLPASSRSTTSVAFSRLQTLLLLVFECFCRCVPKWSLEMDSYYWHFNTILSAECVVDLLFYRFLWDDAISAILKLTKDSDELPLFNSVNSIFMPIPNHIPQIGTLPPHYSETYKRAERLREKNKLAENEQLASDMDTTGVSVNPEKSSARTQNLDSTSVDYSLMRLFYNELATLFDENRAKNLIPSGELSALSEKRQRMSPPNGLSSLSCGEKPEKSFIPHEIQSGSNSYAADERMGAIMPNNLDEDASFAVAHRCAEFSSAKQWAMQQSSTPNPSLVASLEALGYSKFLWSINYGIISQFARKADFELMKIAQELDGFRRLQEEQGNCSQSGMYVHSSMYEQNCDSSNELSGQCETDSCNIKKKGKCKNTSGGFDKGSTEGSQGFIGGSCGLEAAEGIELRYRETKKKYRQGGRFGGASYNASATDRNITKENQVYSSTRVLSDVDEVSRNFTTTAADADRENCHPLNYADNGWLSYYNDQGNFISQNIKNHTRTVDNVYKHIIIIGNDIFDVGNSINYYERHMVTEENPALHQSWTCTNILGKKVPQIPRAIAACYNTELHGVEKRHKVVKKYEARKLENTTDIHKPKKKKRALIIADSPGRLDNLVSVK